MSCATAVQRSKVNCEMSLWVIIFTYTNLSHPKSVISTFFISVWFRANFSPFLHTYSAGRLLIWAQSSQSGGVCVGGNMRSASVSHVDSQCVLCRRVKISVQSFCFDWSHCTVIFWMLHMAAITQCAMHEFTFQSIFITYSCWHKFSTDQLIERYT